ncbi:Gfo/Idh/MocA family oxidoreductase [bacterium]|nr:Gfo/Idh/MocA family oxidoreductase [bacterium]
MLRVAVIGVRDTGNLHADCYQSSPHAQVAAVCDLVHERADASAERLGVRGYYNMHEMLANEEINLVDVCTGGRENGGDHYAPVMAALEAGKHVLCETPLSNSLEHAREMVARARDRKLCLGTNLNYRFTPLCRKARQWIDEGKLGEINLVSRSLWTSHDKDDEWFHLRALLPQSVDVLRYVLGEIRFVQSFLKRSEGRTCWTNVAINLRFESGVVGSLLGSQDVTGSDPIDRTEIVGTRGRLVLENVVEDLWFYPQDSDGVSHLHASDFPEARTIADTYRHRLDSFCEHVAGGIAPEQVEASGEDGVRAQEVIEAAIRSHQTGQVVEVK